MYYYLKFMKLLKCIAVRSLLLYMCKQKFVKSEKKFNFNFVQLFSLNVLQTFLHVTEK